MTETSSELWLARGRETEFSEELSEALYVVDILTLMLQFRFHLLRELSEVLIERSHEFSNSSRSEETALYHAEEEEDVVARDVGLEGHFVPLGVHLCFSLAVQGLLVTRSLISRGIFRRKLTKFRDVSEHPEDLTIETLIKVGCEYVGDLVGWTHKTEGEEVSHRGAVVFGAVLF